MKFLSKLTQCSDAITVNMYDNGLMVEVSGRDSKDDYVSAKVLCKTLEEVSAILLEASLLPRY